MRSDPWRELEDAAALGQGGDLPAERCIGVDEVEHLPASGEEIDLVGGNQPTELQRVCADGLHDLAVALRRGVQRQVMAEDVDIPQTKVFRPSWEHAHDRRLACRDADERESPSSGVAGGLRELVVDRGARHRIGTSKDGFHGSDLFRGGSRPRAARRWR